MILSCELFSHNKNLGKNLDTGLKNKEIRDIQEDKTIYWKYQDPTRKWYYQLRTQRNSKYNVGHQTNAIKIDLNGRLPAPLSISISLTIMMATSPCKLWCTKAVFLLMDDGVQAFGQAIMKIISSSL